MVNTNFLPEKIQFRPDYQNESNLNEGLRINFNFKTQPTVIMFRAKLHCLQRAKVVWNFSPACGLWQYALHLCHSNLAAA